MRSSFLFLLLTASCAVYSCKSRSVQGDEANSAVKSITINQPDLEKEMLSSLSVDEKKKIIDSLVYSVAIKPVQKDSKDDCTAGVAGTKFDSGVNPMNQSTFDTFKVKRGCNYIVSMKIGAKSKDGKAIETLYLSSADEQKPSILSTAELDKPKPVAVVSLFVTAEGKKFWDADEIVTSGDVDATVDATISKTASIKPALVGVVKQVEGVMSADVDLTPKAIPKDMFCGVTVRVMILRKEEVQENHNFAYLYASGLQSKSVVKVPANATAKLRVTSLTNNQYVSLKKEFPDMLVTSPFALCAESEKAALDLLVACTAPKTTSDANFSKECPVNPVL